MASYVPNLLVKSRHMSIAPPGLGLDDVTRFLWPSIRVLLKRRSTDVYLLLTAAALVDALYRATAAQWSGFAPHLLGSFGLLALYAHWQAGGVRWQLCPLYFALVAGLLARSFEEQCARRCRVAGHACAGLAVASVVLDWLAPVVALPAPRGQYSVGRTTCTWTDDSRPSWIDHIPKEQRRRVVVEVWYPAARAKSSEIDIDSEHRAVFVPPAYIRALAAILRIPALFLSHIASSRTHSWRDVAAERPTRSLGGFPVVVFSHALGGTRFQSTALLEELASQGFVCAAVDHPHDACVVTYPDGGTAEYLFDSLPFGQALFPTDLAEYRRRCLHMRTQDLHFVVRCLHEANKGSGTLNAIMDLRRLAVMGHAYGGGAAARFAQEAGGAVAAAVLLEPYLCHNGRGAAAQQGLPQPALVLRAPSFLRDRDEFCSCNALMTDLLCRASPLSVTGIMHQAGHLDFTDWLWMFNPLLLRFLGLPAGVPAGARTALHHVVADHCLRLLRDACPPHPQACEQLGRRLAASLPASVANSPVDIEWKQAGDFPEGAEVRMNARQREQLRRLVEGWARGDASTSLRGCCLQVPGTFEGLVDHLAAIFVPFPRDLLHSEARKHYEPKSDDAGSLQDGSDRIRRDPSDPIGSDIDGGFRPSHPDLEIGADIGHSGAAYAPLGEWVHHYKALPQV